MKKILVLTSVLALAACCFTPEEITQHDEEFAQWNCERVDRKKFQLIYKCPSNLDWIVTAKQQEPNRQFYHGKSLNWDEINSDTEHTYVAVVNFGDTCQGLFHYRVMVKPFDGATKEPYAVISCKTTEESIEK